MANTRALKTNVVAVTLIPGHKPNYLGLIIL